MKYGMWIWNLKNTEAGDPLAMARVAKEAGITDVMIKIANGTATFNYDEKTGKDYCPDAIKAFRAVGVTVWGWHYFYGWNPSGEAKVAIDQVQRYGLDKFIVDAEADTMVYGAKPAENYLRAIKAGMPRVTIGYTTYRFPTLHPDFPWKPFLDHCAFAMPQVYWEQAHNPAAQLARCLKEYRAMSQMPVLPIGAAYKWNGWAPTVQDVREFHQACKDSGLEMASYWVWEQCRRDLPDVWKALVTASGAQGETSDQPQVDPADNERLAAVEKRILEISGALTATAKSLEDILPLLRS